MTRSLPKNRAPVHLPKSWWMDRALETSSVPMTSPLSEDLTCDIAIVGGGFTGLWTALMAKRRDADADVVLIESEYCGAGASGRNGGFATSWWHDFDALVRIFGSEQALFLARASSDAINEIESVCADAEINPDFRRGGKLCVSASPAQDEWWAEAVRAATTVDEGDRFIPMDGAECRRLIGSPVLRAGVLIPDSASVQPAKLALALKQRAIDAGVRIHERTPKLSVETNPAKVKTPNGSITAKRIVMATGAWASKLPELEGVIVPLSSHMIITEPLGERLGRLGWTGGQKLVDGRMLVHYSHVTADGRIAFGRGGGPVGYRGEVTDKVLWDERLAQKVVDDFRRFFPDLADVAIEGAWGGAVDRCWRHMPFFAPLPGREEILVGAGYSGDGVGPSVVGGQILASLALGLDDEWTRCAMAELPDHRRMPPEPFRKVGGELVRHVIDVVETRQERGLRVAGMDRVAAGLAWTTIPGKRRR